MKKILNQPIILSILSGLFFYLSWPTMPFFILIFIAFVPVLWIERKVALSTKKQKTLKIFGYTYLAFFIWNITTTWWVSQADFAGSVVAITLNSFLMTIPILLYSLTKRVIHQKLAYPSLILFWLAWEYLHLNWSLSWPWLTVGNVFAITPWAIQWYEYTGVLGGTTWVLLINILVFKNLISDRNWYGKMIPPMFWLVLPIIISFFLFEKEDGNQEHRELVIVQPNIDAYAKFDENMYEKHIQQMITQSEDLITAKTKYVFWPETSIQGWHIESKFDIDESIQTVQNFAKKHPQISLITGVESVEFFDEKHSDFTKKSPRLGFYESYNTALYLHQNEMALYHKSKFVPGAECEPFPVLLKTLRTFLDFSHMGSYTPQDERVSFDGVAPIICYESIYGEFVGDYVNKGAGLLAVITNDAWWGDTDGHRQHFHYARLRAIEHRRFIIRSANTGISGVIDWNGKIIRKSKWAEKTAIKKNVLINSKKTFYTRYGNYLGRTGVFMSILIFLSVLVKLKTRKNNV